jgi:formylglycine-generating enzyme required for sulfatase activity
VDVLTTVAGPKRPLGPAPLVRHPVLPGYYRVEVEFRSGGFRELICNPGPAFMDVTLVATGRPDEGAITEGMVAFPAGPFTFSAYPGEPCLQGKTVDLDAFLIDATEVSNAAYDRFLTATGHAPPKDWRFVTDRQAFLASHGDRPVVGVRWHDAVDYAAWAGKRLPTFAEWHRVAGGLEGRSVPYVGAAPGERERGNVHGPAIDARDREGDWRIYLDAAAPVRSHPEACSPEGVYHLYGNVHELTESLALTLDGTGDRLVPRQWDRFACGHAWDAVVKRREMFTPIYHGTGESYSRVYLGFRCARSAAP